MSAGPFCLFSSFSFSLSLPSLFSPPPSPQPIGAFCFRFLRILLLIKLSPKTVGRHNAVFAKEESLHSWTNLGPAQLFGAKKFVSSRLNWPRAASDID